MDILLKDIEVRILGSLLEKKIYTPEYYPLSLNALTNACNQKTNRYPVVNYDEEKVLDAILSLINKGLVAESFSGRVSKYEEKFTSATKLIHKESAVLCVLMLRGPLTVAEIKGRTDRLHNFESMEEINTTISNLEEWGFILKLPRQPGQKEQRYIHLLCGKPDLNKIESYNTLPIIDPQIQNDKISRLEEEIKSLRIDLETLAKEFIVFKNQF